MTGMHWNAVLPRILEVSTRKEEEPSRAHQETTASFRTPGGGEIFPFGNCPLANLSPLPSVPAPLSPMSVCVCVFVCE